MASEKLTKILMSKSDMAPEEIEALSDVEAWRVIFSIRKVEAKDAIELDADRGASS